MESLNTNPGSQAVPPAPAPAGPKAPMPTRTLITIGVAAIIIAVLVAVFLHPAVRSWLSSLFGVSLEDRNVMVMNENEDGTIAFHALKNGAFEAVSLPSGLRAYSERNGMRAGIVGTTDVASISGNTANVAYTDGEFKDAVAVSPDGASIVFASMTPGAEGPSVGRYYVKRFNLADASLDLIGIGYAPQFFLRDGKTYILYTAVDGIGVYDVATATAVVTPIMVEGSTDYAVVVSDDGSHLAIRDALTGQYFVYTVSAVTDGKLSFASLRSLPEGTVAVGFRHGKLYAITSTSGAHELLVYETPSAAEPMERIALPQSVSDYKLLP